MAEYLEQAVDKSQQKNAQILQILQTVLQNKQVLSLLNSLKQPRSLQAIAAQNAPYVKNGASNFNTPLDAGNELAFRAWVSENKVPFDVNAAQSDYDMRGFWTALQNDDPRAKSAVNANDGQMHYPDVWKTPSHESFSQDSQWAGPMAPRWNEQDQLIAPSQRILIDEKKR